MKKEKDNEKYTKFNLNPNFEFVLIWIFLVYAVLFTINSIAINGIGNYKEFHEKLKIPDLIIVLLPSVITIISIIFSINDNKIYNISLNNFRRIRGEKYYTFSEMIYFTLYVYVLYGFARIFDEKLPIYFIDAVIIAYSFKFLFQDLPLIEKDKSKILIMFKDIFRSNTEKGLLKDDIENVNKEDLITISTSILYLNGLDETFTSLKTDNSLTNSNIIKTLLDLNHKDLGKEIDRLISLNLNDNFVITKDLEEKIKKIYKNINCIFLKKYNLDLKEHEKNRNDSIYISIACLISSINNFYEKFHFMPTGNLALTETIKTLNLIMHSNSLPLHFRLKILNMLFLNALTFKNRLFFIEYFKASTFSTTKTFSDKAFMIYISMNLVYLINKYKNDEFSKQITKMLTEKTFIDANRKDINSWKDEIRNIFNKNLISFNGIINLFPYFVDLLSTEINPNDEVGLFKFITNCWLELIFYRYYKFQLDELHFRNILNNLNNLNKEILSRNLNEFWFDKDDSLKNKIELKYLDFYNISKTKVKYKDEIINCLRDFKNDFLSNLYLEEFINHDNLDEIKKGIVLYVDNYKNKSYKLKNDIKCNLNKILYDEYFINTEIGLKDLNVEIANKINAFLSENILDNQCFNFIIRVNDIEIHEMSSEEIKENLIKNKLKSKNNLYEFTNEYLDPNLRFVVNEDKYIKIIKRTVLKAKITINYGVED